MGEHNRKLAHEISELRRQVEILAARLEMLEEFIEKTISILGEAENTPSTEISQILGTD